MKQIQHIAIIMDGNRRWAKKQGKPKFFGHTEGAKNIKLISKSTIQAKIPNLTLYALSTENLLNRNKKELDHLFSLINKLPKFISELLDNDVKLNTIGDLTKLPKKTKDILENLKQKTSHHKTLTLTLAINYGGQDEITRAVQNIVRKKITPEKIDYKTINENLDTSGLPPVDLLIRTGGKQRLSNFLLWQAAYAELYFTEKFWPEFDDKELTKAIKYFQETQRNFGK